MSEILGPIGIPFTDLSGDRAWRSYTRGDVTASLQWIDVQARDPDFDHEGPVPCMVLFHAHRRMNTGSYCIPQVNAFHYASSRGDHPPPEFVAMIGDVTEELGFDRNDRFAWHRIFSLVIDTMPDLIRMPSEQPKALDVKREVVGIEATVRAAGQTIFTDLI